MNGTASALELIGVSKEHPGSPPVAALRSVTVTIGTGEFTAIAGPSGSGKSTMLAIASTLERPTAGSVRVAGLVHQAGVDTEFGDHVAQGTHPHPFAARLPECPMLITPSSAKLPTNPAMFRTLPSAVW